MTGNWRRWPRSIQEGLVWIVLILAAPALVGLLAIAVGLYQHERNQIAEDPRQHEQHTGQYFAPTVDQTARDAAAHANSGVDMLDKRLDAASAALA